jgi:endonuclease YncB( thermonuclease family)
MIRRMTIWFAAAHLVLLAAATPQAAPPRGVLATVERVADGDTLMATSENSTRLRIRLLGIDAPEILHRGKPGQTCGVEARQHLVRLVLDRVVRIETFGSDAYRRLLAVIWHDDANVNLEMCGAGLPRSPAARAVRHIAERWWTPSAGRNGSAPAQLGSGSGYGGVDEDRGCTRSRSTAWIS